MLSIPLFTGVATHILKKIGITEDFRKDDEWRFIEAALATLLLIMFLQFRLSKYVFMLNILILGALTVVLPFLNDKYINELNKLSVRISLTAAKIWIKSAPILLLLSVLSIAKFFFSGW